MLADSGSRAVPLTSPDLADCMFSIIHSSMAYPRSDHCSACSSAGRPAAPHALWRRHSRLGQQPHSSLLCTALPQPLLPSALPPASLWLALAEPLQHQPPSACLWAGQRRSHPSTASIWPGAHHAGSCSPGRPLHTAGCKVRHLPGAGRLGWGHGQGGRAGSRG